MEDFVYYNYLLDIYGFLLTEKNEKIFSLYYGENLTMQEIADMLGVSKSFIGSSIKKSEKKLQELESKLQILSNQEKLRSILELNDLEKIKSEIKQIIEKWLKKSFFL